MKHCRDKKKYGRSRAQHKALVKSLFRQLIINKKIITTEGKAKVLKKYTDKVISKFLKPKAFENKFNLRYISPDLVARFKKVIKARYEKRKGGYTRIIKINKSRTDQAKMAMIKLV